MATVTRPKALPPPKLPGDWPVRLGSCWHCPGTLMHDRDPAWGPDGRWVCAQCGREARNVHARWN